MKKVLVFITVMFLVLTLSGCSTPEAAPVYDECTITFEGGNSSRFGDVEDVQLFEYSDRVEFRYELSGELIYTIEFDTDGSSEKSWTCK